MKKVTSLLQAAFQWNVGIAPIYLLLYSDPRGNAFQFHMEQELTRVDRDYSTQSSFYHLA